MKIKRTGALSLIAVLLLAFCLSPIRASAALTPREREDYVPGTVASRNAGSYRSVAVTLNGRRLYIDARIINRITYVPIRAFVGEISDAAVTYDRGTRTIRVDGHGIRLQVSDGAYAMYANDRVLFALTPSVIMDNGRMYVPLSLLAKAFGLAIAPVSYGVSLSGRVTPLMSGAEYYRDDEVYWLSRIISAESRGEPFIGQIAVGTVVMNRVRSPLFPNTIWGVVFDDKYGVQFSPVLDKSIYDAPTASAILAAKICLDGFRLDEDIMFFLAPRTAVSSWIPRTRTYKYSIENHDFYS